MNKCQNQKIGSLPCAKEKGNVLFLILIAVALFAALSYAITKSDRGSGTIARETSLLNASKIIQYAASISQSMDRLRLTNTCADSQFSFENSQEAGYTNAATPSDNSCKVFHTGGGGVSWQDPPPATNDGSTYQFVGGPIIHRRDGNNSTYAAANADLVMYLFGLNQQTCADINRGLNITGIPVDSGNIAAVTKFTGTFLEQDNITGIIGAEQPSPCISTPNTGLCGRPMGCFREETAGQRYVFYAILIDRPLI